MKLRLLMIVLALFVVASMVCPVAAAANSNSTSQASSLLDEFVSVCPLRVSGTEQMTQAAAWLQQKFVSYGVDSVQLQSITNVPYDQNVIATIDSAQSNQVVIVGAHYDTASALCVGANDNASGVVALLEIANYLVQNNASLNFDVVLIAFAGEEKGLLGSYQYVQSMSADYKSNVAMMVNIDSIAAGDNLYVYCENKDTPLLQQLLTSAQGASVQLHSKPFGKGVYAMLDVWGYGYWEMAQNSDHTPFRLAGIPTACFFSGNYKSAFFGYVQSSDLSKWTLNSNDDTLQNLLNNAADYAGKIQTVTQAVCNLVTDDGAVSAVQNARQHLVDGLLFNVNFAKILGASLLVIAMVLGIIYDGKLKKQALLGVAEVKNNQQPTSNNVEDIFKF